jgi:hypothetical protein
MVKKEKNKNTNNDQQNRTKDWAKRTPQKAKGEFRCFTSGTRHVALVTNPVVSHECFFPLYA